MPLVVLVSVGGVLGALARYAVLVLVPSDEVATLVVNLAGCLLVGVLVARRPTARVRAVAGTGVLGGFTTMSALAVQAVELPAARALALVVVSVVGGVLMCRAGLRLGQLRRSRPGVVP